MGVSNETLMLQKKLDTDGKDPKQSRLDFLRQQGKAFQESTFCNT